MYPTRNDFLDRLGLGRSRRLGWRRAVAVLLICTLVSELMVPYADLQDVIMVYLAGVVYVALHEGLRTSIATVFGGIFLFDLLVVPPRWGLNPLHPGHLVTLAVMLGVGLLISSLSSRAQLQREAVAQAEKERLRSTLLSGISHDFRTPLTTIIGAATSLQAQHVQLDAGMRQTLVESILGEAQRLHERVSHLLDLMRMEEGAVTAAPEWCPADDLVAEGLASLGPLAGPDRVEVHAAPETVVWCDPRLIGQALANLVDNALRYTPAGERVRVTVAVEGAHWRLTVADRGPGLPAGSEHDIFRKFYRGQAEPAGTGFGLGLAICAAVARLHGGTITARHDGGAVFTLTLPQPKSPALGGEDAA